jgi:8-oxo-dGTP pyrophosphatase MutT (NUDIX family)
MVIVIRLDDELRARLAANLALHDVVRLPLDDLRHASVAIVIVDSQTEPPDDDPASRNAAFLLCRRAARMNRHAGQWALPGGKVDDDETVEQAALRELEEELGLRLPLDNVLGRLDDYATRSGYVITPVVVWGGGDVQLVPDPAEVAFAYRIDLHELCREDSPRFVSIPESDRPVVQLPIRTHLIHAPTGAVLLQFRWVALEGRANERVNGFEQPVFAWR